MKRFLVLAAIAVVMWACESAEKATARKIDLVLRTSLGNRKQRVAEVAKESGVEGLKPIALDPEQSIRRRMIAILALGTLRGNKEATRVLIGLANGQDAEIAYWAIIALGTQRSAEAAGLIRKFIKHPNPHLRAAACFAIYEYGDKALHSLLEEAASDSSDEVKRAADLMLDWIVNGPPAKPSSGSPF